MPKAAKTKTKKTTAKKSTTKVTKTTKPAAKKAPKKVVAKKTAVKKVAAKKVATKAPVKVVKKVTPPVITVEQQIVNPKNIYLSNKELLAEVVRCKKKAHMSGRLAMMLQLLCAKYAKKGNFINYTYNDDMQAYAMLMLVRTWNSFNPEKSNNPFAFFTQCIKNSFIQYLNQEKRQRNIRDVLLIDQGMNPSYGFEVTAEEDGPEAVTMLQALQREEAAAIEQPYSSDDIEHQDTAVAGY